jgi:predicted amidohydrolase YtcJ
VAAYGEPVATTTLLTKATIWTGTDRPPYPGWLLVDGERVGAVGASDSPVPPADSVLDLTGGHILPGFVDSHLHLTVSAWLPHGVDGRHWPDLDTALAAIHDGAARDPHSPWLMFWNARPFAWPQRRLPTAVELDTVAPGRRILVNGLDVHRGALSSSAMQSIGLDVRRGLTGDIARDRRSRPTGEVWEQAYGEALRRALSDTEQHLGSDHVEALIRYALDRCLSLGITHVHEACVAPAQHDQMLRMADAAAPRLSWGIGAAEGLLTPPGGPAMAPEGPYGAAGREVKLFLDGGDRCALSLPTHALGGMTLRALWQCIAARHFGPLRDALRRRARLHGRRVDLAYLRYPDRALTGLLDQYLGAGFRVRMHALGNLAVRQAAQALRIVGSAPGTAIIDHLVLLDPATTELVAASGAWATYQPGFLTTFGPQITVTGTDRHLAVLGGRQLLDCGVSLTLASDYPAGPLDPLENLRSAVHRTLPDGRVIQPAQGLTPTEAVRCLTTTAAGSLGIPAGGLTPGERADLVICDADPFEPDSRVVQTWIGGRVVWHQQRPQVAW